MEPITVQEIEDFQKAADFHTVRKSRTMGIGSIVFGLINSALGLISLSDHTLNMILLFLGLALVAEGVWISVKPSAVGFLVDGILLFALGFWNLVITIYEFQQYFEIVSSYYHYYVPSPSPVWVIIGFWQFIWGIIRIKRYQRFSSTANEKPSEQIAHRVDALMKSLKNANPADSEDLIEFNDSRYGTEWKGKLSGDVSIFVSLGGLLSKSVQEALFARREDVTIINKGKVRLRKMLKAQIKIGNKRIKGIMSPESLQRYERLWKTASN